MIEKTKEDYLRAIYYFAEEQENKKEVSSVDIQRYLNISKSSVSEMIRKLARKKLIHSELYGKVKLTKKGLFIATDITRKHRIIEVFLKVILKIKNGMIHKEAHQLEHAFSNESINALYKMIGNTENCPHGKKIPKMKS